LDVVIPRLELERSPEGGERCFAKPELGGVGGRPTPVRPVRWRVVPVQGLLLAPDESPTPNLTTPGRLMHCVPVTGLSLTKGSFHISWAVQFGNRWWPFYTFYDTVTGTKPRESQAPNPRWVRSCRSESIGSSFNCLDLCGMQGRTRTRVP